MFIELTLVHNGDTAYCNPKKITCFFKRTPGAGGFYGSIVYFSEKDYIEVTQTPEEIRAMIP